MTEIGGSNPYYQERSFIVPSDDGARSPSERPRPQRHVLPVAAAVVVASLLYRHWRKPATRP